MRILYASHRPPYPFFLGGAARCAHRLLQSMAREHGATCLAVGAADYQVTPWAIPADEDHAALGILSVATGGADAGRTDGPLPALDCGYPVRLLPDFGAALRQMIVDFGPDIVWSQLEGAFDALAMARDLGVQGLLYVHDAEDDPAVLRRTAALGCHVVCSSAFLARKVSAVIGRPAHVVYPASDWCFGTVGDPAGFVTMVNPHAVKGLDTFLEVARRMPQQRFLLQESWKLGDAALSDLQVRLAALPNVHFRHRVADMRAVYAQTRLLIAPSVWQEGFGMVAVEAQSCGIPVIASARGGLPESVGDGGLLVDDYRNPDAWVTAIGSVIGDEPAYRSWSARALTHARSPAFDPHELARRFLAVCRAPAPRVGHLARGVHALARRLGRWPGLQRWVPGGNL